nr:MAG TPA: hypothetical protein [Caudoviricetes sp.]
MCEVILPDYQHALFACCFLNCLHNFLYFFILLCRKGTPFMVCLFCFLL